MWPGILKSSHRFTWAQFMHLQSQSIFGKISQLWRQKDISNLSGAFQLLAHLCQFWICGRAIDLIWFNLCICLRACEIACINYVACSDSKLCHTQSTLPGERRILPIFHLYGENKTFYRQPIPFPVQRTTHTRFPTKILNPLPHLRSKRFENKILQQAVITPLLPYS